MSKKTEKSKDAAAFEQLAAVCEQLGHGRHLLTSGWIVTIKRDPAHQAPVPVSEASHASAASTPKKSK